MNIQNATPFGVAFFVDLVQRRYKTVFAKQILCAFVASLICEARVPAFGMNYLNHEGTKSRRFYSKGIK